MSQKLGEASFYSFNQDYTNVKVTISKTHECWFKRLLINTTPKIKTIATILVNNKENPPLKSPPKIKIAITTNLRKRSQQVGEPSFGTFEIKIVILPSKKQRAKNQENVPLSS